MEVNRSELLKNLFQHCMNQSPEIDIVSKTGDRVSINSYVLNFYSQSLAKTLKKKSVLFMDENTETITLLRDLLTFGEGRFEGCKEDVTLNLFSACRSLNIKISKNFEIKESNMKMSEFIGEMDALMKGNYCIENDLEIQNDRTSDVYNLSTETFIDKIDQIFTSTLKRDDLEGLLIDAAAPTTVELTIDEKSMKQESQIYNCNSCERVFTSKKNLTKHMICHTQVACLICGKGFRLKSLLSLHTKKFHNDMTKGVNESNISDASNEDSLNSTTKMFSCSTCDKTFKSKTALSKHSLCHTNCRCPQCGKGFRMTSLLSRHIRTEHDGSTSCNMCDKVFDNESVLRKHKISKHSMTHLSTDLSLHTKNISLDL